MYRPGKNEEPLNFLQTVNLLSVTSVVRIHPPPPLELRASKTLWYAGSQPFLFTTWKEHIFTNIRANEHLVTI